MTYLYKDATPPAERTPASPEAVHKSPGSTWVALGCAILGVCIIFTITLVWRFSYINQIPVYDLDYITAVLTMFARNWWVENPWAMHFSMPYAPLSVEAATPELRYAMYQSWPPGAVLSIYLVAKLVGSEPSIVMVNWLNVAGH